MNNLRSWSRLLATLTLAATLAVATPSQADELQTLGWANGYQTFGLSIGGSPPAGGFKGLWEGDEIYFWCIELTQYFGLGNTYTDYVPSMPDSDTFTQLGQLFTQAYEVALTSPQYSAAFQLAIWEIVYDGDLSLSGGDFRVLTGNANTVALAQSWLTDLWKYEDTYNLVFLSSAGPKGHQDFVTFGTPFNYLEPPKRIPEPGPIALLAIGALAATLTMRLRAGERDPR